MARATIRIAEVMFNRSLGKWPMSSHTDYPKTVVPYRTRSGVDIEFVCYDPYSAYASAGLLELPEECSTPGDIDNRYPPHPRVLEQMEHDIRELAATCQGLHWLYSTQCYPQIAGLLPELFPLRVLDFGDDCPGSSERKTFPILHGFNAYIHRMMIWDYTTGERVVDKYRQLGMQHFYHNAGSSLDWLTTEWQAMGETISRKWDRILLAGRSPIDLCFIGCIGWMNPARHLFLQELNGVLNEPGRQLALYGKEMRDGYLLPIDAGPLTARAVAQIYKDSLFGLNYPASSLYNGRFYDLPLTGTIQILNDVHHELTAYEVEPGVHYLPFDGTVGGLFATIDDARKDLRHLRQIATAAAEKAEWIADNYSRIAALARCIDDFLAGKIG